MRLTARTLLEALTGSWPKLSGSGGSPKDLGKLPPELLCLAKNARTRDELLEHLTKAVL